MRVLFTAAPEIGHIVPMLGVAVAARDAGHDVRVATHASRHALVVDAGLEAVAAGLSTDEVAAEQAVPFGVPMWIRVAAPVMARDVICIIDDWRADVVIHEEGEYGGPVAAAASGIPWVTHGWGAPLRSRDECRVVEREAAEAGLWAAHGLAVPEAGGLYGHALIDPCPALLDPDRPPVTRTWPVRPVASARPRVPDARRCYIGFGTVPAFANAREHIIAAADAARAAGLSVVATARDAGLRTELEAGGAEVHDFVVLDELLPLCALVITHGGAGTTLAALAHGVPVVVAPQGAPSQSRMAQGVVRAGVGVRVDDAAEFPDAITAALSADVVPVAEAINAMPAPSSVVDHLQRFVAAT